MEITMKRVDNVDKLRGFACLLIVIYHCYGLTKISLLDIPIAREFLSMGGEIGVTIFFVLSGYGIFYSLQNLEKKKKLTYRNFMKARIMKLVPQYYFNIFVLLFLTSASIYINKNHIFAILSHLLFVHSWSFAWHGAINGALWTMAIIFQFYVVAIPIYWSIKKIDNLYLTMVISVLFTIICKYIVLNFLWVEDSTIFGSYAIMIPGRQLITSLDNFVCGMCVAGINIKREQRSCQSVDYFLLKSWIFMK